MVLRDGSTAHLRPIRPSDATELGRFQASQSEQSAYFRFFAPIKYLTKRELDVLTNVDHVDRVALLVTRRDGDDPTAERVIGVGRYDVVEPGTAQVAFNVADAVKGYGLGSVLLEHLAAAARENGITRFVAEVLPENEAMHAVFREAGYRLTQNLNDGYVTISIDLDPTERSRRVMADREHRAEAESLRALLAARRVLLIGPRAERSEEDGSASWATAALLARRVIENSIADPGDTTLFVLQQPPGTWVEPQYRVTWESIPDVDLIVYAGLAGDAIADLTRLGSVGARGVVVMSTGFAETGPSGQTRQHELVRLAHSLGMRVVGPASWGVVTTTWQAALRASVADHTPHFGVVGLFCQSAPAAVTLAATIHRRNLGVSGVISAGHRADVSANDLMQYWYDDPQTKVAALYLESIGNPRKFVRVARRLAAVKPVIAMIAGRSGQVVPPGKLVEATRAPRALLDELVRQAGVLRAENLHQMLDFAQLLAHQPLPAGRRVGILASSAALAQLVAEVAQGVGLRVAASSDFLAPERSATEVQRIVDALYAPDACDVVVVVDVPVVIERGTVVARAIAEAAARTGRTTVVSMIGLHGLPDELAAQAPDGTEVRVPAYSTPEDAVLALGRVAGYARRRRLERGELVVPDGLDRRGARALVEQVLALQDDDTSRGERQMVGARETREVVDARSTEHGSPVRLSHAQATELLACYGLRVWQLERATTAEEAVAAAEGLGWPVALKSASPSLRHRTDLGGVRLDIGDENELREAVDRMRSLAESAGLAPEYEVQSMAPPGVAVVVRSEEDPLFGPVISFGLAGDAVDLLGDVAYAIPPLTNVDVADLVRRVRAAPRLFGYDGAPAVDVDSLEDVVARVSVLADDLPEVASLELYPIVAGESGVSVLHAAVQLQRAGRPDPLRRALPSGEPADGMMVE